ncbi:MAG: hypothetical protein Q8P82_00020 [bacterium]|nr:hypothetical protein [bacterium]
MRIVYFLLFGSIFLSGCAFSIDKDRTVSIKIEQTTYQINRANQFVSVKFDIKNNVDQTIYFEDFECGNSLRVSQLSGDSLWSERTDLSNICLGIAPGKDIPSTLQSGKKVQADVNVSKPGIYRIEFVYFLNEADYATKTNPQSIQSGEFTLEQVLVTFENIKESCLVDNNPQNNSRLVECLYVSAKNVAGENLNLSMQLCAEITRLGHSFDGCYDGVALILSQAGKREIATEVCARYGNEVRRQQCLKFVR